MTIKELVMVDVHVARTFSVAVKGQPRCLLREGVKFTFMLHSLSALASTGLPPEQLFHRDLQNEGKTGIHCDIYYHYLWLIPPVIFSH